MKMPMQGIKVLDLSRTLPGPYCTWILADMGAEVIRVEDPAELSKMEKARGMAKVDDFQKQKMRTYDTLARNKKSLLIDLKSSEAREVIYRLAKESDVFLDESRPGVMKKLSLDYESINKINPRIVYCSISACGQNGPYRDFPGHEPIILALAGLISQTHNNMQVLGSPKFPVADIASGLYAVIGILLALWAREKDGNGQYVDISMLDCTMSFFFGTYQRLFSPSLFARFGQESLAIGIWETKDGKFICTTNMEPRHWERFCKELGREDFIPYQHDSTKHEIMLKSIKDIFLTRNRDEWFEVLRNADTQVAPVLEIDEVLTNAHVLQRNMVIESDHPSYGKVKQLGMPLKLSHTPGSIRHLGLAPGKNTIEILKNVGYKKQQINELLAKGIIKS